MEGAVTNKLQLIDGRYGRPGCREFKEAQSQSFKVGQLVKLVQDTDWKVTECAGNSDEQIYGIAMQDASGTEDTMILVQPLAKDTEFSMTVYHVTPASAVTTVQEVSTTMDLKVTGNVCLCDIATDTHNVIFIKGVDPMYPVGTKYGRYICTVMESHCQFDSHA